MDGATREARIVAKAAFFDRDGTLNVDVGFAHKLADLALVPGAAATVAALAARGYAPIVVSNQSGVARGYFTTDAVDAFNQALGDRLAACGAPRPVFYYCPHHPDFTGPCDCRKPSPGLLLRAAAERGVDLRSSLLIGDAARDVAAAEAVGVAGHLFDSDDLYDFARSRGLV